MGHKYPAPVKGKMRDVGVKAPHQNAGGEKIIKCAEGKTTGTMRGDEDAIAMHARLK